MDQTAGNNPECWRWLLTLQAEERPKKKTNKNSQIFYLTGIKCKGNGKLLYFKWYLDNFDLFTLKKMKFIAKFPQGTNPS